MEVDLGHPLEEEDMARWADCSSAQGLLRGGVPLPTAKSSLLSNACGASSKQPTRVPYTPAGGDVLLKRAGSAGLHGFRSMSSSEATVVGKWTTAYVRNLRLGLHVGVV